MTSLLVTGGTGYFGHGLVRYLLLARPSMIRPLSRVCVYSRDEYKQHLMRTKFRNDARLRFFVGDVRDDDRLAFAMRSVDYVVHAAALKRVEVGEYNPEEMVKTNVVGSMNVIKAAIRAQCTKVVALSTDKACSPLNAYGASKLMVEKMMLAANNTSGRRGPRFAVTRYGNVAGSTGSVIPTWDAIAPGALVPVTDPKATRFWMTRSQAVDLVLWTLDNMTGGELVVPQLPNYTLADLAAAMGREYFKTGMGPGEKQHEMMISDAEAPSFVSYESRWVSSPAYKGAPLISPISSDDPPMRMTLKTLRNALKDLRRTNEPTT